MHHNVLDTTNRRRRRLPSFFIKPAHAMRPVPVKEKLKINWRLVLAAVLAVLAALVIGSLWIGYLSLAIVLSGMGLILAFASFVL